MSLSTRSITSVFCFVLLFGSRLSGASVPASIRPTKLRVELAADPQGIATSTPRLGWIPVAVDPSRHGLTQTAYRILVASSPRMLKAQRGDLWDSGRVASSATQIRSADSPFLSRTRYFWKVCLWDGQGNQTAWSEPGTFLTGVLSPEDWHAHWIAAPQPAVVTQPPSAPGVKPIPSLPPPLPIFRREFTLPPASRVVSAVITASGLGQYDVRINGQPATESVLNPGWSQYKKTVLYNTWDVTQSIQSGVNAIGVLLGNGMYNLESTPGRFQKVGGKRQVPKLLLELQIVFSDGSRQTVVSDREWKTTPGPIQFSGTWGGEDYDARKAPNGWLQASFNDVAWSPAEEVNGPGGVLHTQSEPPIRVEHEYPPVALHEPKKGIFVYDLGQNFSGWPQVQIEGHAGQTVKLIPGELLNADGTVTQSNLAISSGAPSMFQYTLSGNGIESWHPLFSYWGFRYVQVEGAAPASQPEAGKPILSLKGEFLHGDVAPIGQFSSSNELLGRIHTLIGMAILSNTMSILTDCPTREKLGWLEQTHLNAGTLLWNYDFGSLDEKMAADMRDEQKSDGMIPTTAPDYGNFGGDFGNSPEWGSAAILLPGYLYAFTGDRTILEQSFAMMMSYRHYLKSRLQNDLIAYGLGDWYDIGPGSPGNSKLTGKGLTATAIYYQDLLAIGEAAEVLGKPDDAKEAREEAARIKQGFNAALFHADTNLYDRGSQTANAMPLALGMVPAGHEQQVLANLVADIRNHQNHVTAGDVGFHYVVQALTDYGRSDVLYDMMMRTDAPSYGYQLAQGATTLTEAWDANRSSSWNHFMLGHADVWLYRGLAGLRIDMAAKHPFTIQPTPVGNIAYASATYESVLGKVASSWKLGGDAFQLHVEVPVNVTATIMVPSAHPERVTVGGQPVSHADGVSECQATESGLRCVVSSGAYDFAAPLPWKH